MLCLIVTPSFPPENSGLSNIVERHARFLAGLGYKVTVVTVGQERHSKWLAENFYAEYFQKINFSFGLSLREDNNCFDQFLLSQQWSVVFLHAWSNPVVDRTFSLLPYISGRKILFSHCISVNLFFWRQPLRSFFRYWWHRYYWWTLPHKIKSLDSLVFLSASGVDTRFDDLRLAKRLRADCHFVYNVISESASRLRPDNPPSFSDRTFLMAVGSYQWHKGFCFVLKAYALSSMSQDVPLHLFGQRFSRYTHYLERLRERLGLPDHSVVFHEGVKEDALFHAYLSARLVLFGSYTECLPLALVDASAAGAPFVSRNVGCISSMPGGVTVGSPLEMSFQIDHLGSDQDAWSGLSSITFSSSKSLYDPARQLQKLLKFLPA
jgi:1,2-diacylglycerol 3-alpha-glucosyltransferase